MSLDPRRLAMLKEMGIVTWEPRDAGSTDEAAEGVALAEALPEALRAAPPPARAAGPEPRHENRPAAAREMTPPPALVPRPPPQETPIRMAPGGEARRPAGVATMDWSALREAVAGCTACKLCSGRRRTVFGVGNEQADWMVIGEAPGEQEDLKGEPFVGQAGKLLDNMLRALGLGREPETADKQVFIANVLKCRPPHNRNPEPEEVAQCEPYLQRQVELVQPKIILAMGRFAVQSLLRTSEPIGRLRGRVHRYHGVPVVVTYHPAYLLRNLPDKAKAWEDLCLAADTFRAA
ncbi:uracil-DNA glycosylase [Aquabacterium sp. A7-Y]|uniref:uracil-DNA glycosylase n=1 Tax=Aquabacterium sp. A7-Y TaxID=1349605 RepID=UPI00223CA83D|nr:uracil-DNA glycosylase [Aquabacterium sp. A7-Y]MCW7539095.1 uracil-DNA glycosylase [Aquabacterium sp. A7-Y]